MLDLTKLESKLDSILEQETAESLLNWLVQKRVARFTRLTTFEVNVPLFNNCKEYIDNEALVIQPWAELVNQNCTTVLPNFEASFSIAA